MKERAFKEILYLAKYGNLDASFLVHLSPWDRRQLMTDLKDLMEQEAEAKRMAMQQTGPNTKRL